MRVPQRAVPSAPRVWAPKGACAFEIQSSSFSIFFAQISKWTPVHPELSNYHPSPASSQIIPGMLQEALSFAQSLPLEGAESSLLGNWSWAPGLGPSLMAFPWDKRWGLSEPELWDLASSIGGGVFPNLAQKAPLGAAGIASRRGCGFFLPLALGCGLLRGRCVVHSQFPRAES